MANETLKRKEEIIKSCKIIQREINRLKKHKCSIDLAGHTLICADGTVPPKKIPMTPDYITQDFSEQVVFEFTH
ncbi:hypothetical protein GCM10028817_19880 [Spirosoma pomorum]